MCVCVCVCSCFWEDGQTPFLLKPYDLETFTQRRENMFGSKLTHRGTYVWVCSYVFSQRFSVCESATSPPDKSFWIYRQMGGKQTILSHTFDSLFKSEHFRTDFRWKWMEANKNCGKTSTETERVAETKKGHPWLSQNRRCHQDDSWHRRPEKLFATDVMNSCRCPIKTVKVALEFDLYT